jgi:hypothetical protein
MPRIIVLHNYDTPANEVPVDADQITGVRPYGKGGTSVEMGQGGPNTNILNVKESPDEVQAMWKKIGHEGRWK